jgi:hypothetical protein
MCEFFNIFHQWARRSRKSENIMKIYQVAQGGQQIGAFPEHEIRAMLANGNLRLTDLCWAEGMEKWAPIHDHISQSPGAPPPLPVSRPARMGDDAGLRLLLPVGRSAWAIAAGYLGLFSLVVLPAPIALVVSIIAIRDIRKSAGSPHPKHGMGRAIFGLIMGILGTAIGLLVLAAQILEK